jgi:hypothetical protein
MISWLLQPLVQIVDKNGNPVVGAKVYVYYSTPETLATIYSDDAGTVQENPVLTDTLGNVTIFADTEYLYDVIVYDPNGNLLFGKKHIAPASLLDVSSNEVKVEAGDGISVTKTVSEGQITYTVSCDFDVVALEETVAQKQDRLEAGQNIEITNQNIINVTGRKSFDVHSPLIKEITDTKVVIGVDGNELKDYILTGGLLTGAYVPWSASNLPIGNECQATNIAGAFGIENTAKNYGYVFGTNSQAYDNSFAVGFYTDASGNSISIGNGNTSEQNSLSQGYASTAYSASFAQGVNCYASTSSFAQGYSNTATNNSVAIGLQNSSDRTSFVHGFENSASFQSQVFGFRNIANTNSTVFGFDNNISNARVFGYSNSASNTKIIGDNCSATNALFVAGNSNTATVDQSFAIGAGLSVQDSLAAMGTYNIDVSGAKFVYGVGTSNTARKNAFYIDNNDKVIIPDADIHNLHVTTLTVDNTSDWVDYRDGYSEYTNDAASNTISFSNLFYITAHTKIMAEILIPNLVFNPYGTFGNGQVIATLCNDSDEVIWKSYYPLWSPEMAINVPVIFHNKTNNTDHLYLTLTTTTNQQFAAATRKLYFRGGMANLI